MDVALGCERITPELCIKCFGHRGGSKQRRADPLRGGQWGRHRIWETHLSKRDLPSGALPRGPELLSSFSEPRNTSGVMHTACVLFSVGPLKP